MAVSVIVRESTMVKPAVETPRQPVWLSNLDMISTNAHTPTVYIYKPKDGADSFFDPRALKDALSKALVPFYPLAGRLRQNNEDKYGRAEIDCNANGVLFVVADSSSCADDLADLKTTIELGRWFIPSVDCSDPSSYPLFLAQVTYLKCGGVALGIGFEHCTADGFAALDFVNAWSDMARGVELTITPTLDRTLLRARDPPQPLLEHNHHVEYYPPPPFTKAAAAASEPVTASVFKFTREQINILKAKALATKKDEDVDNGNSFVKYSSYEVFAAHVWISACKARELADDEETQFHIAANGRSRLQPPLPPGFFGNVVFSCVPTALVRDLISKPISYAASLIHKALARMNDEYLRSALDYLELQQSHLHLSSLARRAHYYKSPNVGINSWVTLPMYDADFGWGRPVFVGRGGVPHEGKAYMVPSAGDDRSFSLGITLQSRHMNSFSKLINDL